MERTRSRFGAFTRMNAIKSGSAPTAATRLGRWLLAATLSAAIASSGLTLNRAEASTVLALSLEEMTRRSDVIAVAVAAERNARRDHNGSLIVTDFQLDVETGLKGVKQGARIVATVLGGELDGLALQVPGEASFVTGQRVIVFLSRTPSGAELRVVGMSQGVLPIFARAGEAMVGPGGQSAELVEPGADGELHAAPAALLQPQPLDDLVARIRSLVTVRPTPAPNRTTAATKPQ